MSQTLLLIAHSDWREGRLTPLLEAKGFQVEWRCPANGDSLPTDHAAYAGTIVLGGIQSANDTESQPYLRQEIDWIARYVARGHRYLGICLGGQLLARALGARVGPHDDGLNEIGYYQLYPTAAGRDIIPEELHVYHWHQEGFDIPSGAHLLARGSGFPHQAFRYGSAAYGLQFHPEVTTAVAAAWIKSTGDHLARPGAQPAEQQLGASARFDQPLHEWFDGFLDYWLTGVEMPQASSALNKKAESCFE
ncbi:MAG: hypothetical protein QOK29_222 [Rhodospirillaceae bacterium]|nr:hypothetical protein [Rhodospirillaceae bacterium]